MIIKETFNTTRLVVVLSLEALRQSHEKGIVSGRRLIELCDAISWQPVVLATAWDLMVELVYLSSALKMCVENQINY